MKAIVIGAGSDLGVHIDGAKLGSVQLLNDLQSFYTGETASFQQPEDVIKSRNLSDREKNKYELEEFNSKLYKNIVEKTKEEFFPIVIGGDHSVGMASALASIKHQPDIGTIWISAHTNYCTRETTTTGNLNEFSLMTVSNQKNSEYRHYHDGQIIQPSKTVIIGVREISQNQKDDLKYSGVTVFTMDDIKEKGIEEIIEQAFNIATFKTQGVHVSFSLDVLDPEIAPGVSAPIDDGLTQEEALKIHETIAQNIEDVIAYDLVEYNPLKDENRKTEQIAVNLLAKVLKAVEKKDKYKKIK
jgi:arginase